MPAETAPRVESLPPGKRLIKLTGRGAFVGASALSGLLSPGAVRVIGGWLGSLFYFASARHRRVALKNLSAAFPDMPEAERVAVARESFRHFCREALQFFRLMRMGGDSVDKSVELVDFSHIEKVFAAGKGCIFVTAHYGNWEMMARKLVLSGCRLNVIARDSDDPGMTGIATRIRESGGYRVFDKSQPLIGAYRCLKNNEGLGLLPDQNDYKGIPVDFLGRPALTATGPAELSLRSGAPIVPVFCRSVGGGRYVAQVYPPLSFEPSGDRESDVVELTRLINLAIADEIRRNPSQWLWFHDRWRGAVEAGYV